MNSKSPQSALESEFTQASTLHPVEELRGRGIRNVRVLNQSRWDEIAREAVSRTLRAALDGIELPENTRALIEARAQAEFKSLLEVEAKTSTISCASPAPASLPSTQGVRDSQSVANTELKQLISKEQINVRSLVSAKDPDSFTSPTGFDGLEKRMVSDLSRLIEKDWRQELQQVEDNHRQQLQLLEARISKLVSALDSTDRVIDGLRQNQEDAPSSADYDPAPRTQQPIDPEGPLFKKKTQLLNALFQANVQLQELEDTDAKNS